jgi:hypothetical protein
MLKKSALWIGLFLIGAASAARADQNTTNLQIIRSALSIYYGDTEGAYPTDLNQLIPKYLTRIPDALCNGIVSNRVTNFASVTPNNTGGWGYVNLQGSSQWGSVFLNCFSSTGTVPSSSTVSVSFYSVNRVNAPIIETVVLNASGGTVSRQVAVPARGSRLDSITVKPIETPTLGVLANVAFKDYPTYKFSCHKDLAVINGKVPPFTIETGGYIPNCTIK